MSTTLLEHRRCLVLNKGWTPVGTISLQRALTMVFNTYANGDPKATIIDHESYQSFEWEDWSRLRPTEEDDSIRSGTTLFRVPEVILLGRYDKIPKPRVHFSRRNLYKRDKMMCQYCGVKPGSEELTIDHILPRAQGGITSWENCTLACVKCNSYKAARTPKQARMKLLTTPKKPRVHFFRTDTLKPVKSWEAFLGEAYWNVGIGEADDE